MKVDYISHMGDDNSVCDAARCSFDKLASNYTDEENEKLISYLAKHNHWSPFSHCYLKFRIKAPIFVARQLQKHTVGLAWNEVSRRYVDSDPEFFYPPVWRGRPTNGAKQGSSDKEIEGVAAPYLAILEDCLLVYNRMIDSGVAPEQARMILPQSMMTTWVWSGSLYAFIRVCKLRLDPHSQKETRLIAEEISKYLDKYFPISWKALHGSN